MSRDIALLHPKVRDLALSFMVKCSYEHNIDILIYCTYRSKEEQDELYKIGRTVKGNRVSAKKPFGDIVTNARGGQSLHNYGLAFDWVPLIHGKAQWSNKALYAQCGAIAESLGLEWAGRWTGKLRETAHCQFTGGHNLTYFQSGGKLT